MQTCKCKTFNLISELEANLHFNAECCKKVIDKNKKFMVIVRIVYNTVPHRKYIRVC